MKRFAHSHHEIVASSCVALIVSGRISYSGQREYAFSGFVVELDGHWMWVTAAHVLDEIEKIERIIGPCDYALKSASSPMREAIPFRFHNAERIDVPVLAETFLKSSKDLGPNGPDFFKCLRQLDISCLWLEELYSLNLAVNGVVPFKHHQIGYQDGALRARSFEFERQILLAGFPTSDFEFDDDGDLSLMVVKVLPIHPTNTDEPTYEFEPLWNESLHFGSVCGMSGGPIVATGFGHPILIGVQSSEIISSRSGPSKVKVAETANFFSLFECVGRESQVQS